MRFHFLDAKKWLGKPRAAFEKTPRSRLRAATRESCKFGVAQIPSVTPTQAATQAAARASRPLPKSNSPRRQNAAGVGKRSTARRCRISRHTPERKLSKSGISPLAAANLERSHSKESVGFIVVFNVSFAPKPSIFLHPARIIFFRYRKNSACQTSKVPIFARWDGASGYAVCHKLAGLSASSRPLRHWRWLLPEE